MRINRALKKYRAKLGISQAGLARKLGVSQKQVSLWEAELTPIREIYVLGIAAALSGANVHRLLERMLPGAGRAFLGGKVD